MRCKYCKNTVENGSLYCRFCGSKLFKTDKKEKAIPKPVQLKDGRWRGQIMVDGQRQVVYGSTLEEYEINARAVKAGLIELTSKKSDPTLGELIDNYINSKSEVLSPSTVRNYSGVRKYRFQAFVDTPVSRIDFQEMIILESRLCAPMTLKGAWAVVTSSLRAAGIVVPSVNLPRIPKKDLPWLDYQQIRVLLEAVKGSPCELAVILALHSLRSAELLALTAEDIYDGHLHVNKTIVLNAQNDFVHNGSTKTVCSSRAIPVIIPRLYDLLPPSGRLVRHDPNFVRRQINAICEDCGLPKIGFHGLRRSFASLGYHLGWSERSIMQIGGWTTFEVVHRFYIKLSQDDLLNDVKRMQDYYQITTDSEKIL